MRTILSAPAWPYANGPRHIGHVSGFGLPCDMFSRYQRMAGNRVLMVSGTDEHGTPIQVQADAEGVTARELAEPPPVPVQHREDQADQAGQADRRAEHQPALQAQLLE